MRSCGVCRGCPEPLSSRRTSGLARLWCSPGSRPRARHWCPRPTTCIAATPTSPATSAASARTSPSSPTTRNCTGTEPPFSVHSLHTSSCGGVGPVKVGRMNERVIKPVGRGFLFLDSHPDGCAQLVRELADQVERRTAERRVALVIGSSSGYGLAATIAGLARYGIDGVGVAFEKEATVRRTASAGWYRTAETAALAQELGREFHFVDADAFADTTKSQVLDLLGERFGGVDHLIYSVAAPRRVDPRTGETYQSALRAIGNPHRTKSIAFEGADPVLQEVEIEAATDDEIAQTVKVMGGEDWSRWVEALTE